LVLKPASISAGASADGESGGGGFQQGGAGTAVIQPLALVARGSGPGWWEVSSRNPAGAAAGAFHAAAEE